MGIFSWFSKKPKEEDYEQVLASLALSIQKRQTRLSELRLRERRATLLVTTWTFTLWVAYVALWWAGAIGQRGRAVRGALWGLPVILGPLVIVFTRRIIQLWFTRKGNAEEKTLKDLMIQQRNKLEEIKKKTNYYTTKSLLDRYDESAAGSKSSGAPSGPRKGVPSPIQSDIRQQVPQGAGPPNTPHSPPQSPARPVGAIVPQTPTLASLPPPQKQWYDKLADAILGDDSGAAGSSAASRYALICERCFTHNGLVKEEQWEDAQYLCPKCGHFNMSARARKAMTQSQPSASSVGGTPSDGSSVEPSVSAALPSSLSPSPRHESASSPIRRHEPMNKSPLSESTVLVEKEDVEENPEGYDASRQAKAERQDLTQMEVDS